MNYLIGDIGNTSLKICKINNKFRIVKTFLFRTKSVYLEKELKKQKQSIDVIRTGCIGMCSHEVLVDVIIPGHTRVTYEGVKPDMVPQIVEEHIVCVI